MSRTFITCLLLLLAMPAMACGFRLKVDAGDGHGHVRRHFVFGQCGGDNVSPAISWKDAPSGTRSFAVTTFDPDANAGAGWWHWAVIDLPARLQGLAEHAAMPAGARVLRNDFGQMHWGGPCPPKGDPEHHYVFTVYALDVAHLELPSGADAHSLPAALSGHVLGRASITLRYGR